MTETIFKTKEIEKEYRFDIANMTPYSIVQSKYGGIVDRSYNNNGHSPAYSDISNEFECFREFAKWFYDEQDSFRVFKHNVENVKSYEYQLDKDLIGGILGVREYSRRTCVFLPKYLNTMLETNAGQRRDLPIGVTMGRVLQKTGEQTYSVYTTVFGKTSHILIDRSAPDMHIAHNEYKLCKEYLIRRNAEEFYKRGLITPIVYYALLTYVVKDDTSLAESNVTLYRLAYSRLVNEKRNVLHKLEEKFQEYTIPELDKMTNYIQTYPMKDIHELLGPYERSLLFKYIYKGVKPTHEEYNGVFKRRLISLVNGDFSIPKMSDYDLSKMRK